MIQFPTIDSLGCHTDQYINMELSPLNGSPNPREMISVAFFAIRGKHSLERLKATGL